MIIMTAVFCLASPTFSEETSGNSPAATAVEETATAVPAPSEPEKAPAPAPKPSKPMSEMDILKEQVKKLEEKLSKMEEENDIRRRLETTDEEKSSTDESILSAAGRDYTLMKPGKIGFEYAFSYAGSTYDSISTSTATTLIANNAFQTMTNAFFIEYPVKENLTVNTNIPFVYKYSSNTSTTAKDVNDFGDVYFGAQFQPIKSGGDYPSLIVTGSLTCPTGRSPYKIDSTREISTGNGVYSIGMGCNLSKSIDPLVAFGGFNIDQGLETKHLNRKIGTEGESGIFLSGVKPGMTYSMSMGIGYSLSYKTSLTLSYQYSYQSSTHYDYVGVADRKTEGTISSVFSVGTGWTITPKRSVNVRLGIGLTNNDSDFTLQVRVPFTYEL
jgi:hypothetical protein